jgi:tetratricopeptide (TPR) repeat protein
MIGVLVSVLLLAEAAVVPAPDDAESLFREGLKAYDAKQYARAIEAFEAAHKLSPLPEIQYDIAMARRAIGDCRGAADGFDAFIAAASPEDPLLARAQARRAELGSCASAPAIG